MTSDQADQVIALLQQHNVLTDALGRVTARNNMLLEALLVVGCFIVFLLAFNRRAA